MIFYEKAGDDPKFKQDCKDYENEKKAIHHMTELIQSTFYEREKARKRYHNALKPMRNTNDWEIWTTDYGRAAQDAEDCGVNDMKDLQSVIRDFMMAVSKVAPYWNTNFHGTQRFEAGMTRQKMMKSFRHHMNEECPEPLKVGGPQDARGTPLPFQLAQAHHQHKKE
ncbi:hypothetical protein E4U33_004813 [Claviceps sp. LM78 group G4]|nr:hypothetical protein E4U33_004813 [Claviceps sp. LM78 group G4]